MKKLLLLFCLCGPFCFAQADFTRVYYPIINEAELAIVDTSYYEALQFYNEAFANVQRPFAKDYYNAAICATMVGKMPLVFEYLEKIVEKGYKVANFRKDAFFKNVADTCKKWPDFEKQVLLIEPAINRQVRDSLQKIKQQQFIYHVAPITADLRNYYKPYLKNFKWVPVDSLIHLPDMPKNLVAQQDSLRLINAKIATANTYNRIQTTLSIIDLNGYPDENMIGLNSPLPEGSPYAFNVTASYLFQNTLLDEIFQEKANRIDILSVVKQAIRDGKADPHILKSLIDYSTDEPYTMGKVLVLQLRLENNIDCPNENWEQKKEQFFWKKERPGTMTEMEINEKRLAIGLEKLEDAYKKAFFKARNTPFLILGGTYLAELAYIPSCELIDKTISGTVMLK
ncbi:hypothetical protein [Emticicia fluvialis]|uniref:hypothetical protein n=1 Tax=Emticicia fluvialis TaxID=2974474 RepID=UPI00216685AA|nr:hypothetical protein [Emticicia fluvialis]